MKDLLENHGFKFTRKSFEQAYNVLKYSLGEYEVIWRVNKKEYSVKRNGRVVKSWSSLDSADSYLTDLLSPNQPAYIENPSLLSGSPRRRRMGFAQPHQVFDSPIK